MALKKIRLHGALGKKFETEIQLDADTTYLVVRGLCSRFKGFEQYFRKGNWIICPEEVTPARSLNEQQIHNHLQAEIIHILPDIEGGDNGGVFSTILGVVVIAVGIYFESPQLVILGVGLLAGGIAQMLAKNPDSNLQDRAAQDQKPSFSFSSATNTIVQGFPVPCVFGRGTWGSYVVSSGIDDAQVDITTGLTLTDADSLVAAGRTPSRDTSSVFQ